MFEAAELRKSYVTRRSILGSVRERLAAVAGVSFEVNQGETVALVGESGSGKSTTGRLALGLIRPDSGSVRLNGQDLAGLGRSDLRRMRSRARMIFQDPFSSLDPRMVVGRSLASPLELHTDLNREQRRLKANELLERVGLSAEHYDRYPYEFSGGQLQRIAVARAIATDPDFVVCDEPVAALDMSIRAQIITLLNDLQKERGIAYLFISHDLLLVRLVATRVLVMYQGEIVEQGPVERIFEQPEHPYTKALLAATPKLDTSRRHARRSSSVATAMLEPAPSEAR